MKSRVREIQGKKVAERIRLLTKLADDPRLEELVRRCRETLAGGGKIVVFGNGGSATQACHFAAELVNKFHRRRRALPALSLAGDLAVITSVANDEGFAAVFSRQIEALGHPGDAALGLTTSGRSANVLAGFAAAKAKGMSALALCGRHGHAAQAAGADFVLTIDSEDTPLVQESHLFVLHYLAEQLEIGIKGEKHG